MLRYAPPPDFRYVWLVPGPSFPALSLVAGTVGISSLGLAFGPGEIAWSATSGSLPVGLAALGGAVFVVGLCRRILRPRAPFGSREVTMAIVPWGIVVEPGAEPRILRWPAIREIDVNVKHTLRGGTPAVVASVVTIRTEREVLSGQAPGGVGLESLTVNLKAYADEASRPPSADLEGREALDAPGSEGEFSPLVGHLLRHARDYCSTSRGASELVLPSGGYRRASVRMPGPETRGVLTRALSAEVSGEADPRPLASLVAALIGAEDVVPDLLKISNSPSPLVAAVARASALRLGAAPAKVGPIDELKDFLFEEDREILERFAAGQ